MPRVTMNFSKIIGMTLFLLGTISLVAGIAFSSTIPALIGLGLIFWGIILTYIQTHEYIKKKILDSTTTTLLITLDETLGTLEYKGKAIYLPPKYLNDPETTKIYIPKSETGPLPTPDATRKLEMEPAHKNAQGILITSPAAELMKLFEATLGASFLNTNLQDLQQRLPKALIEDLEVMTDIEIKPSTSKENGPPTEQTPIDNNKVQIKFTTTAYKNTCKQAAQLQTINSNIGCPLTSALASALAKTIGKPIIIENEQISEDGGTTQVEYLILKEET